jgi:hypothetical protein
VRTQTGPFLCLSERFMSVLCLSANDQKWGILCLSASECLFMIVGPIVGRLMLIRPAIAHLMPVRVWKIIEIDLSRNDRFFGHGLSGSKIFWRENAIVSF